jgi:hypothetical protein
MQRIKLKQAIKFRSGNHWDGRIATKTVFGGREQTKQVTFERKIRY